MAQVVSDLIEIDICTMDALGDSCDASDAGSLRDDALTGFLGQSISRLRQAVVEPSERDGTDLTELVDLAQEHWGEHLELMAEERQWLPNDSDLLAEPPTPTTPDGDAPTAPMAGDLHQLLSALAGTTPDMTAEPTPAPARHTDGERHVFEPQASGPPPAPTLPAEVNLDSTLQEAYLEDACQCLGVIEQAVLKFEQDLTGTPIVPELCRELHTLKGASASVGLKSLAAYLHQMEEWLEAASRSSAPLDIGPVLCCVDTVQRQISALQSSTLSTSSAPDEAGIGATTPLIDSQSLTPTRLGDLASGPAEETVRVKAAQLDRLMDLLAELVMLRNRRDGRVSTLDRAQEELSRCMLRLRSVSEDQPTSRPGAFSRNGDMSAGQATSSRPRTELSEVADDIREISRAVRQVRQPIADEDRAISQFIGQFRQELVGLRRQPLTGLFRRLQRVARDAAVVESKRVRLQLVGEHAGLERSLQERLYEPLLHMIRNAVGHGIESEEQRQRAGKDPVGTITLEALGSSHLLVLEIRDDGRGLDFDAIRRRGIERGLLPADRPVSERELSRLIFHPGFSTREGSNQVAGRGIGMDVVATTLERLHCLIEVDSVSGQGSTFRLTLPLRSVIEHTLVFRCGGQLFGVPMQFVRSAHTPGQDTPGGDPETPPENLPALSLPALLKLSDSEETSTPRWLIVGHRRLTRTSDDRNAAASSSHASRAHDLQRLALKVDEIVGHEEVVVRPLPALLKHHPLLSGATLSGAGEVMLLLDGHRLLNACRTASTREPSLAVDAGAATRGASSPTTRPHVLVVDDSLSARMRLVEKLQRHGLDITEAGDGVEALDLLRTGRFDAIFSDLEMPRIGGFDLLVEVKEDVGRRSLPVVIVTTRSENAILRTGARIEGGRISGQAGHGPRGGRHAATHRSDCKHESLTEEFPIEPA